MAAPQPYNPFDALGLPVSSDLTKGKIVKARRRAAFLTHTDRFGIRPPDLILPYDIQQINAASDILTQCDRKGFLELVQDWREGHVSTWNPSLSWNDPGLLKPIPTTPLPSSAESPRANKKRKREPEEPEGSHQPFSGVENGVYLGYWINGGQLTWYAVYANIDKLGRVNRRVSQYDRHGHAHDARQYAKDYHGASIQHTEISYRESLRGYSEDDIRQYVRFIISHPTPVMSIDDDEFYSEHKGVFAGQLVTKPEEWKGSDGKWYMVQMVARAVHT